MKLARPVLAHEKSFLSAFRGRGTVSCYCTDAQLTDSRSTDSPSANSRLADSAEYMRRNYANNISEYNTVIASLNAKWRPYLLRDVYEDMMLDGVQPNRDTFHSLIAGSMKGSRLQDAFFFRNEMKAMGIVPDASLYNFLISTCGKCQNSDHAIQLLEEMKRASVKPTGQTYICLLNACGAAGRVDRAYAIVRDMTAAGLGLNRFCYAGLIAAFKNRTPISDVDETSSKIIELVKQSKGWSSIDNSSATAENVMMGVYEEELYNIPTADFVHRRGVVNRQLTVYHAAFHAAANLKNIQMLETLLEMLNQDGYTFDAFIVMQIMRCYLHCGDLDKGVQFFDDYMTSGKFPMPELFVTLAEGAMIGYTAKGMLVAQEALAKMNDRNFLMSSKTGSELLLIAAGEKTGGYTTANYIWDLMQTRNTNLSLPAVEAYYYGLKQREIPADDPRLLLVTREYENLRLRFGNRRTGPPRNEPLPPRDDALPRIEPSPRRDEPSPPTDMPPQ